METLIGLPLPRLRERLRHDGYAAYRAEQLAGWLYGRGVSDPSAMTDLPADLRGALGERFSLRVLEVESVARSADGTLKGLLRAADGARIESVLIPEGDRTTLCLSTQVGCALACRFCATGAQGFTRNLRASEVVDQVIQMRALAGPDRSLTNFVFMGMGEPLLNLGALLEAIALLLDPKAFGVAGRRITVSTVGVLPQIGRLLAAARVNLAVSLHAAHEALRAELVPISRRYPIEALFQTLERLPQVTPRWPVFFEYTLLRGVNDAPEDARQLVRLLRRLPSKLNLIPMNPHPDAPYEPPAPAVVERFLAEVARGGFPVTLRRSRGGDIAAACGQLALRGAPGAHAPGLAAGPAG